MWPHAGEKRLFCKPPGRHAEPRRRGVGAQGRSAESQRTVFLKSVAAHLTDDVCPETPCYCRNSRAALSYLTAN